jgi:2-polyprenyl-3-methyl-5-hydroxy-6-metoxy-1,4-benzoquinol methylase
MLVKYRDFNQPWLHTAAIQMHEPINPHRKLWEYAAIAFGSWLLNEGDLRGKTVLGFGVGTEPLPAWFVSHGAEVIATDAPHDHGAWTATGQRAEGMHDIQRDWTDMSSATFELFDMNAAPGQFEGLADITYSAGSLEHIGGIEASMAFLCNQMKCLKPGGLAFHTTEFSFDRKLVNYKNLCVFQQKHLQAVRERLYAQGDSLLYDLSRGKEPEDYVVDPPPYGLPHLKLDIDGVTSTSILLVMSRGPFDPGAFALYERWKNGGELDLPALREREHKPEVPMRDDYQGTSGDTSPLQAEAVDTSGHHRDDYTPGE